MSESVLDAVDVAPVWSGHPVGFALLTHGRGQFVAFYDAERQMTVASRALGERVWTFAKLPERVVWDSHNYITLCVDDDDHLHLSGNMHVAPLVYFRTTEPVDIGTLERVPEMVGEREGRCTYPRFFRGPRNELLFTYRDGSSGNGDQVYNVYDHASRTWRRLLDEPLLSGQGKMNAYFVGPRQGLDGHLHLCWVWRDTPDCASNHDLSYARSTDLVQWETSGGTPLELPITLDTGEVVDPVPPGGGIINGNTKIGFDSKKRVVLSYHKNDAEGNTQIYNARREDGAWRIYQASNWDYPWRFQGGGSIEFEIRVGSVAPHGEGTLAQGWSHKHYGPGTWLLDEATMAVIGEVEKTKSSGYPEAIRGVESTFEGMQVRWAGDSGSSGEAGVRYTLRWETLGPNRDRAREGARPEPSMLRVYKLGQ
ncbi:MAG TPA: hypothetical protein ENN80_11920 [Candidatus Hydrogenedentes bacterium]|nr:hypothetical protein [Candidatus Hydrogenedentota bacterium]